MSDTRPVKRALLAVYHKTRLTEFARALSDLRVELVASGGTAAALREAGLAVTSVEEVTGSPEMLGGRVKTLHPKIHAGILGDPANAEHARDLEKHGIKPFDLVVCNLYPFRETVESGAGFADVIEDVDIGGPAMIRAAAKNHAAVAVVVEPGRYEKIAEELRREGGTTLETRRALAADAFAHTAAYDAAIANWFAQQDAHDTLPSFIGLSLEKVNDLRYGENPHQRGALYSTVGGTGPLGGAKVLQGKEMSFNNWLDTDSAYSLASEIEEIAAVIVKHNNPCGAATGSSLADAYARAFESDTVSAFGGIVAFNREVDEAAAAAMADVFTEVVVAPGFNEDSFGAFGGRENLRVVQAPPITAAELEIRPIPGGALVQDHDDAVDPREATEVVSAREPTDDEWRDLLFAGKVAARVKSNAIVFAKDSVTVGIGAGQMSRVDSAVLAVRKAGDRAKGAVMASDAFFPFPDAVEIAAEAGVVAVIHPGGSIRDEEVLKAAEAAGMAVVVTGSRHFRH